MMKNFKSKSYKMEVDVKSTQDIIHSRISLIDLKPVNNEKYVVQLEGSDELGVSKLEGLLILRGKKIIIKVAKVYVQRPRKAGP